MTVTITYEDSPSAVEVTVSVDSVEHIVCCSAPLGGVAPAMCGAGLESVGGDWDDVPPGERCVVCDDLDRAAYCPHRPDKRCPYGAVHWCRP